MEMRRFDEACTLAALVARGEVDADIVRSVARHVAAFHLIAEPAPPGGFDAGTVAATVSENFGTLLPYADALGARELAAAHRFAVAFLHAHHEQLEDRATRGFVRDCHGDLRAEHVILEGDSVEVFDPVEFDPALRRIDVSADLAFLVMDLVAAGADDLAGTLIAEYESAGGDHGGRSLLFFYAAYRAWVRAKVACLRAGELAPAERARPLTEARHFAKLARRLAWRARRQPVIVICGASATGKTHLAECVASLSGLPHISSDVVRKRARWARARAARPRERVLRGHEHPDLPSARRSRRGGDRRRDSRRDVQAQGPPRGIRRDLRRSAPLFVECLAPAAVVAERAARRELDPERVSDATAEIAALQRAEFEPLDEVAPAEHLAMRTDRPVDELLAELEASLDARLVPGGDGAVRP